MLTYKQLIALPFNTLRIIAIALAKDIDDGIDKRYNLELVFRALAY